ncbi:MAG: caspase family protein [Chloroflexota bacterium]
MTQGISIHIGLNRVDPAQYHGWEGVLTGCINDAQSMDTIATRVGYGPITTLIDDHATRANVISAIGQAAQKLQPGDILLVSYSGHGGEVPDANGDEPDHMDETWALYDGELIDDELYLLWSQFAEGVRILVFSDSCHSGTVTRDLRATPDFAPVAPQEAAVEGLTKAIPNDIAKATYEEHKDRYTAAEWMAVKGRNTPVKATVLLISGCQDNQESMDAPWGRENGAFTAGLLDVWQNGNFQGDYHTFWQQIVNNLPAKQQPNFFTAGVPNPVFEAQKPFTISG